MRYIIEHELGYLIEPERKTLSDVRAYLIDNPDMVKHVRVLEVSETLTVDKLTPYAFGLRSERSPAERAQKQPIKQPGDPLVRVTR